VYNAAIRYAVAHRAEHGQYPSFQGQTRLFITDPRRELPWLAEVPYGVLGMALRDAQQAQLNHVASLTGKRRGPKMRGPVLRKKRHGGAVQFGSDGFKIRGGWQNSGRTGGRLFLGGYIGWVGVRWSRPLPSDPTSATVVLVPTGRWYVSFVVREPLRRSIPQNEGRVAGVDLGLTHFATIAYSEGKVEKIDNPRFLLQSERKLAHLQRDLARKQGPQRGHKPSKRWEKQRRRVAALHSHIAHQRTDFARREAARLIRVNQAIVVEALNIAGLARTKVRKSLYDTAWGIFLKALAEGAATCGRDLIVLPRFFPGTRTCASCGIVDGAKPLRIRAWTCPECGATLDRDANAAVNHLEYAYQLAAVPARELEGLGLAAGLAERINARGRDVADMALAREDIPDEARIGRTERCKRAARRRQSQRTEPRRKHVREISEPVAAGGATTGPHVGTGGITAATERIGYREAPAYPRKDGAK
jgi:putative transposase